MKTIISFFGPPIMRLCLMIFLGMTALAAYSWISWSCLTPSDWAAWIGAVGTVGTLIGTIFLANKQNREKRDSEINLAALVAATVLPLAYRFRHTVWTIRNQLLLRAANNHPPRFLEHVHDLQALPKWSAEDLLPLAVLPNQAAYHLEHARGRLAFVEEWLANEAATMYNGERPAEDSLFIQDVVSVVQEAQYSLRIAIAEMERIVPNHALFD